MASHVFICVKNRHPRFLSHSRPRRIGATGSRRGIDEALIHEQRLHLRTGDRFQRSYRARIFSRGLYGVFKLEHIRR
jgi:hypothetical protein